MNILPKTMTVNIIYIRTYILYTIEVILEKVDLDLMF